MSTKAALFEQKYWKNINIVNTITILNNRFHLNVQM